MKKEFKDLKQQRVYIRNFVDRNYIGSKECVICGKEPSTIVHNIENPYNISFICKDCRVGKNVEELENLPKVNILEHVKINQRFSHSSNLILTENLKYILENALKTEEPLMTYLRKNNLSYVKYKRAVTLYEKEVKPIKNDLKEHFDLLRAKNILASKSQS